MSKLTILFDANPLVMGQKSGVGYYTQGLVQALATAYPNELELIGHYFSFLGRKDKAALPTAPNITYVRSRLIPGKVLSITRILGFQLPLELFFKRRGDVALFTNFVSLPSVSRTPRIVAVHDLCYLEVPEYVPTKNRLFLKRFVPRSITSAKRVITISEATKRALKKHYNVADDKILITHIPPPIKQTSTSPLDTLGITKKFILFLGNLEPRKNISTLVEAYVALPPKLKQQYQLVLAGGKGWYIETTLEQIATLQAQGESIVLTGYINDEQKRALYEQADLFVLPSFYEGFGMPILEAMRYGTPVACSDIAVFHEVAEDAAVYFDQTNPPAIADCLADLLARPELRKQYSQRGLARLKRFPTWEHIAQDLYQELELISKPTF